MRGHHPAANQAAPPESAYLSEGLKVSVESPLHRAARRFFRNRPATISLIVLAVLVTMALAAPLIQRYPPDMIDLDNISAPPTWEHWLGTDMLGRDVWSRVIHGGRVSLSLGLVAALATATIGTFFGLLAGFLRGIVDTLIMRLVDVLMTIPGILVLLILVMYLGPGLGKLLIILPAMGWMGTCRMMRGQVLSVREVDYVLAARCLGFPTWRIIVRQILPNAFAPILVGITMSVGSIILSEAGLSFLGLGVQPPTPSWGNMLQAATVLHVLQEMLWLWLPPGILIVVTVLCVNFLGDGLRDAIDPRMVL